MAEDSSTATDVTDVNGMLSVFERVVDSLATGFRLRVEQVEKAGQEYDSLLASLAQGGTSATALLIKIVVIVAMVAALYLYVSRTVARGAEGRSGWRRFLAATAAAVLAVLVGFVAAKVLAGSGLPMRTLRIWTLVVVGGLVVIATIRRLLVASRRDLQRGHSRRIKALHRDLSIAIGWTLVGMALVATMRLWGAGPGIVDAVAIPTVVSAYLMFVYAVWRHRRTLAAAVAGRRPRGRWRTRFAKAWPAIVLAFILITFISTQTAATLRVALPGSIVFLTALIFLATPHLDTLIGNWARRGLLSPRISVAAAAARQTARFTVIAFLIAMLGVIWATPLAAVLGIDLSVVARRSVEIALIVLVAVFLWNVIGTLCGRALQVETSAPVTGDEVQSAPRSRLETLVPLLSAVGKSTIVVLTALSVLVSLGVTVWPIITGLSVFGLAVGFGSQTLVKDIVSGLFFLVDDAFRFGEYIETSGAKGTVEKISIRSVSLRHQRGALATIPYGQIGKIQNFSRDWMIEKLTFRVAFDTDVEKVRKIFKKIGQDIAADPEIAGDLLEPFKSQGISEVEDGTLVIRAKFKAKAGKQSMIRRAALKAVHDAFLQNGIKAVPKPITSTSNAASA